MIGTNTYQPKRYTWRGTCVALLSVLTILLFASTANATSPGPIILSQSTKYSPLPGGGAFSGEDPAGGSMAVNSRGVVVAGDTYGSGVVEWAPPTYTGTVISPSGSNVSAVAIDSSNFLYVADQYNGSIIKVPMNADGTYTITVATEGDQSSLSACAGDTKTPDTAGECVITNPGGSLGGIGISAMTFSASGALFFATDDQGESGGAGPGYSIYECKSTCLYGATPTAPILIYAENVTPAGNVATQGQYYVGGLALDAYGNLFFTDSAEEDGSLKSAQSNLWELPVVTKSINATLFAAVPINILNLTNGSPGDYDNAIDAVAADSNGHLYVSIVYSGIYGLVDNGALNSTNNGTATTSSSALYGIANQVQTKLLASDNNGNFYAIGNGSSGDTLYFISTGPVKFTGTEVVGVAENVSAVVADNTAGCTPTLTFTSPDSAFTATTGTCGGMFSVTGSFVPVTLTYTPTVTGFDASTLTVNDTTSSASSAPQNVSSTGASITISQGTYGVKLPSGGGWGGPSPDGHTAAINSKGVLVFGTSYGNQVTMYTLVNGVTSLFGGTASNGVAATFNGAGAMAIDSSDNLYMSSEYGSTIYKVAMNADGSYGPLAADANNNPLNSGGTAPVACVGGAADVTAGICSISLGAGNYNFGLAGMVLDGSGNLFFTTDNQGNSNNGTYAPDTVFACNTSCLYGGLGNLVALYAEPIGGTGNPQLVPGSISIDGQGNLYFTDFDLSATGTEYDLDSHVYRLAVNNSQPDGYAATPELGATLTPSCANLSGCNYNDAITTVSADAAGDVFFGTPYDGIFEIPQNSGSHNIVVWAVGGQQVKTLVPDGHGNFYFLNYNNGDDTGFVTLGSVAVTPMAQPSAPSTVTNVWAIDNGASCYSDMGNLTFLGVDTEFTATAGGCGTLPFGAGAKFAANVTFTPLVTTSGNVSSTLTATNSNSGDTGSAAVSGVAAMGQTITWTNPTASESVDFSTTPIVLAATGGASGNPVTFAVASGPGTLAGDGVTLTITGVGAIVINATQAGGTVGSVTYAQGTGSITITVNQATPVITCSGVPSSVAFPTTISLSSCVSTDPNGVLAYTGLSGATLSGTTLTPSGVGTVSVTVGQASDADYTAATLPVSVTVTAGVQTITFAPASPVTYSATPITLSATGGASGNPVTLTVASGPGTLSGNSLTLTGTGTVVIDANQAASANYAAAAQVQASIVVNAAGTVATPAISPASGTVLSTGTGGSDTVTITDATSGATIWYTTDNSDPATSGTAIQYTAGFTLTTAGSATVKAIAVLTGDTPSAEATATYTVTASAPAFTAASSSGTSTSSPVTISSTAGTTTLTLTPTGGFHSAITLSCTASTGISVNCSFSPASPVTPTGNDAAIPVTVTMTKGTSALLEKGTNPFLPGGVTFALALGLFGWRKRRGLFLALLLVIGAVTASQMVSCGGSSGKTGTVTIGATGGGTTTSTVVNVVVK